MLQQQQQELSQLRDEVSRQRAVSGDINRLSAQLGTMSTSVTDSVAEALQRHHQVDCILIRQTMLLGWSG